MNQRNKALVRKFLLATVGNGDLRGTLKRHIAFVCVERVGGQAFYQAAALYTADGRAPAVRGKCRGYPCPQGIRGVSPEILGVIAAIHVFFVAKLINGLGVFAIGQSHENVRHRQTDVARVFARAERLPLCELRAVEDLSHITGLAQLREVFQIQEFRGRGRKERSVRACGDLRNFFEKFDVFGMPAELIVSDQCAERLAAKDTEFLFIDFLEQSALVEFGGALQITQDFLFADVHNTDLQLRTRLALVEEILQATPAGFQLLKSGVMQNLVELKGN